jgi:hypothetical protein
MEHHRFASFVYPFWVTYPTELMDNNLTVNAWVPIDDENTMIFNIDLNRAKGTGKQLRNSDGSLVPGLARPLEYLPRTTDWQGRWRAAKNSSNDFGIDRKAQRMGLSYSGITGVPLQDQAIQESMGPMLDRTIEHLAESDRMVVLTRKMLLKAARSFAENGKMPDVFEKPELASNARGGDIVVPAGTEWLEAYEQRMAILKGRRPKIKMA